MSAFRGVGGRGDPAATFRCQDCVMRMLAATLLPVAQGLALGMLGLAPPAPAAVPAGVILPEGITVQADLLEHEAEPGKREGLAWRGQVRASDGRLQLRAEQMRYEPAQSRFLGPRLQVEVLAANAAAAAPATLALSCDAGGALVGGDAASPTTLAGWRFACIDGDVAATPPASATRGPRG